MRISELLRLVWLNINQNRFKTIMTSIGIVVGAATIVMVIAIGRGGKMDVAEQFSNLNAGAIDISYEYEGEETSGGGGGGIGGFFQQGFAGLMNMFGGGMNSQGGASSSSGGSGSMPSGGDMSSKGGASMPSMGGASMPSMGGASMPSMGGDSGGDTSSMGGGGNFQDFSSGDGNNSFPDFSSNGGDSNFPDFSSGDANGDFSFGDRDPSDSGENHQRDKDTASENEEAESDTENAGKTAETEEAADTGEEAESETDAISDRLNQEEIILSEEDVEDILLFVPGVSQATISYSTRTSVEGGNLSDSQTYTVVGVKESFAEISNLSMAEGEFISDTNGSMKDRVCVLGSDLAKEIFGSASEAMNSTLYIDDRAYTVIGVLDSTQMVTADISPDEVLFIPYETGIKYITGESISPLITVISEDVNAVDTVIEDLKTTLAQNYATAEFTYSDAGSKMEAAESSNAILTTLLTAMAAIVFIVGGIGIMNVLFVSVKERTNEIGILKALGASRKMILGEFLLESAAISLLGGVLGVGLSFAITPLVEHYGMRVEANAVAWSMALGFAVLTGTIFGFYPAWKASRMIPVEALQAD